MTYETDLSEAKRTGRAWGCTCGTDNPPTYDCCHACQRPSWTCAACRTVTTVGRSECDECGGTTPAELLGDGEEGFEMTWAEWINTPIGPRIVGGHYDYGDDATAYEVLDVDPGPRPSWPIWQIWQIWQITVRRANGQVHTHCSRLDARRDRAHGTEPEGGPAAPASAPTLRCPQDGGRTEEYQVRNPETGDVFDRARCTHCSHSWDLDPGADALCRACGGSGSRGSAPDRAPCTALRVCRHRQVLSVLNRIPGSSAPGTAALLAGRRPSWATHPVRDETEVPGWTPPRP
ncbi:hypothetical protein OG488_00865 [Streptomyces sp. NBC_01460]|uniref:hypothetical protein n=1 Tax=Streptomyces sp. NBC_01460 TaxID=2903875 RepID=UPI002E305DEA|nr:hypothetical protein [Streptomyces sp. NBC_01460]